MAVVWEWHDRARCRGAWPPVDMIALDTGQSPQALIEEYCNRCPVIVECAEFALSDIFNMVGIWGGVFLSNSRPTRNAAVLRDQYARLTSGDAA